MQRWSLLVTEDIAMFVLYDDLDDEERMRSRFIHSFFNPSLDILASQSPFPPDI
jgi:hypothetical protein